MFNSRNDNIKTTTVFPWFLKILYNKMKNVESN